MKRQLVALLIAAPVVMSCTDAPTSSSLDPQAGFALSNPPPPPVGGISYGFSSSFSSLAASPLGGSGLTTPVVSSAPQSQDCSAADGICMPADFFQNAGGSNVWMNFKNTGLKLPKAVQSYLGASQSPGRIQYANGFTTGQGFAWAWAFGSLWVLDLSQFSGPGNIFDVDRETDGDFRCAAIGAEESAFTIMEFVGGQLPAQTAPFRFFQFATQEQVDQSGNPERLCFPLETEDEVTF